MCLPPRGRIGAAALVWLAGLAGSGSAEDPPRRSPYVALVHRYAAGEREVAVQELGSLPPEALRADLARFKRLKRIAARCPTCEPAKERARFPFRAAVMLHTDRAWLGRTQASPSVESPHAGHALQMLDLSPDSEEGRSFARRWFLAMALRAQADAFWPEALRWAREGLRRFPEDAELLLAAGTLEETLASIHLTPPPPIPPLDGTLARVRLLNLAPMRTRLHEAEEALTLALAADPSLDEARLRLGRVSWRLGKLEAAAAALDSVLAREGDARTRYLALLFRGRVHEDARQLDDAVRSYAAAAALDPTCQTANLALSHALHRKGQGRASRDALEAAVERGGRRSAADAFWSYPWGQSSRARALLETLREEARS
jgi:tetratricopeptide (TPR) repeat protein